MTAVGPQRVLSSLAQSLTRDSSIGRGLPVNLFSAWRQRSHPAPAQQGSNLSLHHQIRVNPGHVSTGLNMHVAVSSWMLQLASRLCKNLPAQQRQSTHFQICCSLWPCLQFFLPTTSKSLLSSFIRPGFPGGLVWQQEMTLSFLTCFTWILLFYSFWEFHRTPLFWCNGSHLAFHPRKCHIRTEHHWVLGV